jgi:hypothetical protein
MSTYETVYLMNETSNLIGQIMVDIITVIFAILAAAFIMGSRLSKSMVVGISILSSIWVLPMALAAYNQFGALGVLSKTLTIEQLGNLDGLIGFLGAESILTNPVLPFVLIFSHVATFIAALWFLNHSRKSQGLVSL